MARSLPALHENGHPSRMGVNEALMMMAASYSRPVNSEHARTQHLDAGRRAGKLAAN